MRSSRKQRRARKARNWIRRAQRRMGYPLATDWEPWMQKIPYGPHLTRHIVYHKICWGMVGRVINPELYLGPPELDANGGLIRPTKAELLSQAATELPQKQVAGTRHDLAHAVAI